jgi:hypothetical protein
MEDGSPLLLLVIAREGGGVSVFRLGNLSRGCPR